MSQGVRSVEERAREGGVSDTPVGSKRPIRPLTTSRNHEPNAARLFVTAGSASLSERKASLNESASHLWWRGRARSTSRRASLRSPRPSGCPPRPRALPRPTSRLPRRRTSSIVEPRATFGARRHFGASEGGADSVVAVRTDAVLAAGERLVLGDRPYLELRGGEGETREVPGGASYREFRAVDPSLIRSAAAAAPHPPDGEALRPDPRGDRSAQPPEGQRVGGRERPTGERRVRRLRPGPRLRRVRGRRPGGGARPPLETSRRRLGALETSR